jgi:hypothetical protein
LLDHDDVFDEQTQRRAVELKWYRVPVNNPGQLKYIRRAVIGVTDKRESLIVVFRARLR